MNNLRVKKMAFTAVLAAFAVAGSFASFPVFGAKCAPAQHLANILGAVFLGPSWNVAAAFTASLIRNLIGAGTPLAFPGSMCGALLAGVLYRLVRRLPAVWLGEIAGTGVIGGLLSYPVARFVLGNEKAALLTFVVPFLISSAVGAAIGAVVTVAMKRLGLFETKRFLGGARHDGAR